MYGGPHQEAHVEHGLTHTPATLHLPVFNTNIRFKVIAFYNFFYIKAFEGKTFAKIRLVNTDMIYLYNYQVSSFHWRELGLLESKEKNQADILRLILNI